jgi:uncharacterized protein with GYD domain
MVILNAGDQRECREITSILFDQRLGGSDNSAGFREHRITSRGGKGARMATFIVLFNFTEQGIRDVKETGKRADAARKAVQKAGASIKEIYWTLGAHDGVLILEAPDDETAATVLMDIGRLGNVRSQTLRAFGQEEIKSILAKIK